MLPRESESRFSVSSYVKQQVSTTAAAEFNNQLLMVSTDHVLTSINYQVLVVVIVITRNDLYCHSFRGRGRVLALPVLPRPPMPLSEHWGERHRCLRTNKSDIVSHTIYNDPVAFNTFHLK